MKTTSISENPPVKIRQLTIHAAALLFSAAALAHHSGAMFEDELTLTLSGQVTHFDYVNRVKLQRDEVPFDVVFR